MVVNRTRARADELARSVPGASAADWEELQSGELKGDVLLNTTSLGLSPGVEATPVPLASLERAKYSLVFDAIYNPLETRLLREAKACGAVTVGGLEMFVGQAAAQFELFTGEGGASGAHEGHAAGLARGQGHARAAAVAAVLAARAAYNVHVRCITAGSPRPACRGFSCRACSWLVTVTGIYVRTAGGPGAPRRRPVAMAWHRLSDH